MMNDIISIPTVGHMIHHVRMGRVVQKVLHGFPSLSLAASIQPITRSVLRVRLTVTPEFEWDDKLHGGSSEPWWIWVEDPDNNCMYHSEYFLLQKKQVRFDVLLGCYTSVCIAIPGRKICLCVRTL